jgi:hypothetical protein
MQTSLLQNGYLKLMEGDAEVEKGSVWHLGFDVKADHVYRGLSALVGYSYNRQETDILTPKDTTYFNKTIVNTDSSFGSWQTHTLHFMLDYDFSVHRKASRWAPRINIFYNHPFYGKNAYKTWMLGGGFGIDFRWSFGGECKPKKARKSKIEQKAGGLQYEDETELNTDNEWYLYQSL